MAEEKIEPISFIRIQKIILTVFGLWPYKEHQSIAFYLSAVLASFGVAIAFLITLLLDIIVNYDNKEIVVGAGFFLFTQLTFVVKISMFVMKRNTFFKVLATLDSPHFNHTIEYEDFIKKWWKFADVFVKFYLVICYSGSIFFASFPFIDKDPNNILPFRG